MKERKEEIKKEKRKKETKTLGSSVDSHTYLYSYDSKTDKI
jgi:hypothetical protein